MHNMVINVQAVHKNCFLDKGVYRKTSAFVTAGCSQNATAMYTFSYYVGRSWLLNMGTAASEL